MVFKKLLQIKVLSVPDARLAAVLGAANSGEGGDEGWEGY
jgi:hypothetical protein